MESQILSSNPFKSTPVIMEQENERPNPFQITTSVQARSNTRGAQSHKLILVKKAQVVKNIAFPQLQLNYINKNI